MSPTSYRCCALASILGFVLSLLSPTRVAAGVHEYTKIDATLSTTYQSSVRYGYGLLYHYSTTKAKATGYDTLGARVFTSVGNGDASRPVVFVVRQRADVASWEVPSVIQNPSTAYLYNVTKTICLDRLCWLENAACELAVEISTTYEQPVSFQIRTFLQPNFTISMGTDYHDEVDVAGPKYYLFNFPDGYDQVLLIARSDDTTCMVVTATTAQCPNELTVADYDEFTNPSQSMTKVAAITIPRPASGHHVFIMFDVPPDNSKCIDNEKYQAMGQQSKKLKFSISPLPDGSYTSTIVYTVLFFIGVGLILVLPTAFCDRYSDKYSACCQAGDTGPKEVDGQRGLRTEAAVESQASAEATSEAAAEATSEAAAEATSKAAAESVRTQPSDHPMLLVVSDLHKEDATVLGRKYRAYVWTGVNASIFYIIPTVQVVLTVRKRMYDSGDDDICYYNFLCARPHGLHHNFNNMFSNIGYMICGLWFIVATLCRWCMRSKRAKASGNSQGLPVRYKNADNNPQATAKMTNNDRQATAQMTNNDSSATAQLTNATGRNTETGIPPYYGIYYTMGWALMVEGVMSLCYHICPSSSNFQFDMAFMYIMGGLVILRIYQSRHPDINPEAGTAFVGFAVIVLVTALGMLFTNRDFTIAFTFLHILVIILISVGYTYSGCRKEGTETWVVAMSRTLRNLHEGRLATLVCFIFINVVLVIWGWFWPFIEDVGMKVFAIVIGNLLIYTMVYLCAKCCCSAEKRKERRCCGGEKPWVPSVLLTLSVPIWIGAFWYFRKGLTNWKVTAAESRAGNKECILLDFYDDHDIWHILSAVALFVSFMAILHLDDDVRKKPANKLYAF